MNACTNVRTLIVYMSVDRMNACTNVRTLIVYMSVSHMNACTNVRTLIMYIRRVSFRKMGKGGQNNTYKINGGAKGVHAIVRLLGGLGT